MSNSNNKNISKEWPRSDGRTVPAGYFDDFAKRIMAQLPETAVPAAQPKRTVWQKIRPYVYMAAMFAGVYLMMNIFTLTAGLRGNDGGSDSSMLLAELTSPASAGYVDEYIAMNDTYFYDDLYESGCEIPENI